MTHEEVTDDYGLVRTGSMALNNRLVSAITGPGFKDAARRLGMLVEDTIVFGSEEETSILSDFAIYDCRVSGSSVIERFAADPPPDLSPEQRRWLRAAQAHDYFIYEVDDAVPKLGAICHRLGDSRPLLLVDRGFSTVACRGLVLASRLICLGDYWMTTGASLPVEADMLRPIQQQILRAGMPMRHEAVAALPPGERARWSEIVIRYLLRARVSERVRYADHDSTAPAPRIAPPVGRYDPCPCGSGKKFKFCCESKYR